MNKLHELAVELKYEGKTYKEISKKLDGELTEGTLKEYFSKKGKLHEIYSFYSKQQGNARKEQALDLIKKSSLKACEAVLKTLSEAQEEKDYRVVLKASQLILDRAGITTINFKEKENERIAEEAKKPDNLEDYYRSMVDKGLDPATGRSIHLMSFMTEEERITDLVRRTKDIWEKYKVFKTDQKTESQAI